ncbi:hypothetical protein [Streptomyces pinistramenti]|uniref:hypothetical protein n=1 Tax=Streptomyces pinistramenti TaxID=2884812 RepID=UPI0027E58D6A|nr:hypothetical protein [Streptomyces pinistramenti]
MTVCVMEDVTALGHQHRAALTIAADGSYAARLARHNDAAGSWYPERWTMNGPEPYAVPLPGNQPEEPDSELLPLADGRVLIRRRIAERFALSLLYPTGPGTGELPLGTIEAPELTLLPPAPGGRHGYALTPGEDSTSLWLVHGGRRGPEHLAEVPGRCTGGVWLDHYGRLLAVDQELDGRTKTVAINLERGGETTLLLAITEESNDRLLLADPDSGLLIVRSDAPGQDRLGWGVLGSARPVRFPESLHTADPAPMPFAVQPGQMLTPENCAVAFRLDAAQGGTLGVWRPAGRRLRQLPAPEGWLSGAGRWTAGGELLLPYVTDAVPCGVARMAVPLEPARGHWVRSSAPLPVAARPHPAPPGTLRPALPPTARTTGTTAPLRTGAPPPDVPPEARTAARDTGKLRNLQHVQHLRNVRNMQGLRSLRDPDDTSGIHDMRPLRDFGKIARFATEIAPTPPDPDNGCTASSQPDSAPWEPFAAPAHPPSCRPVPLQQAPLAAGEARWSVITRPVRI